MKLPWRRNPADQADAHRFNTLAFLDAPHSAEAEAIRSLRTRIMAQHVERGHKTLAICAATPDVGCSFVAANLAVACAHIGVRTVIIDCDMRTPTLAPMLGLPTESIGLSDHLANPAIEESACHYRAMLPILTVVTAGKLSDNPQELLATKRFQDFATSLSRQFDLAIFDTTPANYCTDAQRVATVAGHSIIVARKHHSFVSDVATLSRLLRADHSTVVGTVLTVF